MSEDTVRRDLRELAAGGHVLRVHGGALPRRRGRALRAPARDTPEEKAALAAAALPLLDDARVVLMDGGTTASSSPAASPPSASAPC